jgi:hypothetical protein
MKQPLILCAVLALLTTGAAGESRRVVTVKELFELNHQLTVEAGTEVVWGDPHFERVWFPSNTGPRVKRTKDGFVSVFEKPGTYRGRFTVVAGHGTAGEIYSVTVIVKGADR